MDDGTVDSNRLEDLMRKRLLLAPEEIRASLPSILTKPRVKPYVFVSDKYAILAALDRTDQKRIASRVKHGREPFPGLVKPDNLSMPVSMKISNMRNSFITGCQFSNIFCFSLGKDCSLVLVNTKLTSNNPRIGRYNYVIGLAYLVSFGDEIHSDSLYDFFEDLIAYSLKQWRGGIAAQRSTS